MCIVISIGTQHTREVILRQSELCALRCVLRFAAAHALDAEQRLAASCRRLSLKSLASSSQLLTRPVSSPAALGE